MSRRSGPPSPPGDQQPDSKPTKRKGRGGPGAQLKPTLVMLGLLVAVTVVYFGVRTGRESVAPQPNTQTLPADAGGVTFDMPASWKIAEQDGVAGGGARYAAGPSGSRDHAFFVTRYPLTRPPANDQETASMLREATRSLRDTGAAKPGKPTTTEVDGKPAWRFHYTAGQLDVQVVLILVASGQDSALFQLACQSSAGAAGDDLRDGCDEAFDSVKFS